MRARAQATQSVVAGHSVLLVPQHFGLLPYRGSPDPFLHKRVILSGEGDRQMLKAMAERFDYNRLRDHSEIADLFSHYEKTARLGRFDPA